MTRQVTWTASTQRDEFEGTVVLDRADFEMFSDLLDLDGWVVLGLEITATHPSIGLEGKDHADESYTTLTVWALPERDLPNGGGLEKLLQQSPVNVTEFHGMLEKVPYPHATDAISLVLRGAKRFVAVLWSRAVHDAGIGQDDFEIVGERELGVVDGRVRLADED